MGSLHNETEFIVESSPTMSENIRIFPIIILIGLIYIIFYTFYEKIELKLLKLVRKVEWIQKLMKRYKQKSKDEDRLEYCLTMDEYMTGDDDHLDSDSTNQNNQKFLQIDEIRKITKEITLLKTAIVNLTGIIEKAEENKIGFTSASVVHPSVQNGWPGFHCYEQ